MGGANKQEGADMEYCTTIGADVSDKKTQICVMNKNPDGKRVVIIETSCATTKEGFLERFSKFDRSWPVVFETGTHCRWMDKLFREMGFKTIIANPSKVPSITKSNTKNDRNDARELARLAIADPEMLHPIKLRDEVFQQMLRLHHSRNLLIAQRTQLTNQIRGFAKSMGYRIEKCSTWRFHKLNKSQWPSMLEAVAWPLIDVLETIDLKFKAYDAAIQELSEQPEFKSMVDRVRNVYGVGIIGSTVFIAAIGGDPNRFEHSRDIGPFLGLVPSQDQSGDVDKQLHLTKAGSNIARRTLTECAGVILMSKAPETDLKLKGLRIAIRGGKIAKKKAKLAVARCLAVTMIALLKDPSKEYVALSETGIKGYKKYYSEMEYLANHDAKSKASKVA